MLGMQAFRWMLWCLNMLCVCVLGNVWAVPEEFLYPLHRPYADQDSQGEHTHATESHLTLKSVSFNEKLYVDILCHEIISLKNVASDILSVLKLDWWFYLLLLTQLEVLTNLANETNISTILREFQVSFYMFCSYGLINNII